MRLFKLSFLAATLCALALPTQAQDEQINILCSVQVDWCNLIQTTFSRVGGVKVNIVQRSTGEALVVLAQAHGVAHDHAVALQPRQARHHGGAGDAQLARQVGRALAGIGLQQGDQIAIDLVLGVRHGHRGARVG